MSNNKPDISLESLCERLASMMDNLATGNLNPEVADRIVKGADGLAKFAELELKTMALAWSHDRDVLPGPLMGALIDPEDMASGGSR